MYQPNTDALYHGSINDATRELARLMYEVAKAHDVPYVSACAFYHENEFEKGGDEMRPLRRIAWCSGGGQSYFEGALSLGVDAFLSGEISEPQTHMARESGIAYIAAGHHATERGGVAALAAHLAEKFGLDCEFIDIDNPV